MDYILEETVGQQPKRVAVAVGRLNPPTRGHYKVIDAMKAFIRANPKLNLEAMPVLVIVAGEKTSKDKSKNPLTAEERKSFIEASGKANGVKVLTSSSAFAAFEDVRKAGFEPIAVAAGSDRAAKYIELLDKYFKTDDDKPIKHYMVPGLDRDQDDEVADGPEAFDMIARMIEDGDEVDDAQISGTLARYLVKNGKEQAFAYVVGLEKKPKLAKQMFDKVKAALTETA